MYDYNNGRFLSVDPFIQNPTSTQSMNPYTYIFNNPLSGTDPTGYFVKYLALILRESRGLYRQAKRALRNSRNDKAPAEPTPTRPPNNTDVPRLPPIMPQPSDPSRPPTTTSPAVDNFGSSTESPSSGQTNPISTANDNGNQNSNQGTMMNENKGDTSDIENQSDKGNIPSDTNVCRGGTCGADQFTNGSGVTTNSDGTLEGVSTQSKPGASVDELSKPFKNGQVGVTTVGEIEAAGGTVTLDGGDKSNHATVSGITAEQAESLFTPTIDNPVPKEERGKK